VADPHTLHARSELRPSEVPSLSDRRNILLS
jgi:hypothetical protein